MILIQNDNWRLWCDPSRGVQWLAGQVKKGDNWVSIIPDCRNIDEAERDTTTGAAVGQSALQPLQAASFHMIPYSNRIRNGQFTFRDQTYQLANAKRHAIHGALRQAAWQVIARDTTHLHCGVAADFSQQPVPAWPWPMRAEIEQHLSGPTLSSTIRIQNLGSEPMPAGTGWHPYFVRRLLHDDPILHLPVSGVFPDATGDCLPDGPPTPLPDALDFTAPRLLDPDHRIDCCLSGLSGPSQIHWPDAGISLTLQASEACRFLVLFNPDMPHFALEPVTNANDGFNLDAGGIDAGTLVIDPMQTLSVSLSITVNT